MPDYTIPNLKNACRILDCLGQCREAMSNAELANQLDIPRSTVLRILCTLESQRFVRRIGKRYLLGMALIPLGTAAGGQHSLLEECQPLLASITQDSEETSHLVTRVNDKALILQVCASPHPMSAHSRKGTFADLHCSASGKVLLAYLPEAEREACLERIALHARTPHTLTRASDLKKELQEVRRQGYAIDEQEYHLGVRCMATPVFSKDGSVCHAIGITASIYRFTEDRIPTMLNLLQNASRELSVAASLGLSTE